MFELKETITLPRRYIFIYRFRALRIWATRKVSSGIIETVRRAAILISIYASARATCVRAGTIIKCDYTLTAATHAGDYILILLQSRVRMIAS